MPLSVTYALDCASGAWRLGDFPGTTRDGSSNGICLQRANFCGENQPRVFLEQKLMRDERARAFSRQLERSMDARLAYEDWYHISGTLSFLSFSSSRAHSVSRVRSSVSSLVAIMTETITSLRFRIRGRISRYSSPLLRDASSCTSFSSHRYTGKNVFSRIITVPSRS